MSWLLLAALSALFLGIYDVAKKWSLDGNAVLPVLFATSLCGAVLALPYLIWPGIVSFTLHEHLLVLGKAAIVTLSWVLTYFGIKHLPISIASPIRASAPVFTIVGAVALFAETPTVRQWVGIAVTILGYWVFSVLGRREGVSFRGSAWVWMLFAGTAVAACSGLYDKVLMQRTGLDPITVQFWFTEYNALLQVPIVLLAWWPLRKRHTPFQWRWSIPVVALLLLVADNFYFHAMSDSDALVSVVSAVRRSNVVVSFAVGGLAFREANRGRKSAALVLVLAGLLLMLL